MPACDLIPMEYNVVVEIDKIEAVTKGGIFLPPSMAEQKQQMADEGTIAAISPLAFNFDNWPDGARVPQLGDRVLIGRYAGVAREKDGVLWRIVKDKDIIAVISAPEAVAQAA